MPYEVSPSPVAPVSTSRLWTVGASIGIAIVTLLVLAVLHPELANWLVGGAVIVAASAWLLNMNEAARAEPAASQGAATEPAIDMVTGDLLDRVFEALDDPVLVVSGGEPDDIAGRRIVMANAAARELLRIQRQGALLVQVIREPGVLEAVDEALFGGTHFPTL